MIPVLKTLATSDFIWTLVESHSECLVVETTYEDQNVRAMIDMEYIDGRSFNMNLQLTIDRTLLFSNRKSEKEEYSPEDRKQAAELAMKIITSMMKGQLVC